MAACPLRYDPADHKWSPIDHRLGNRVLTAPSASDFRTHRRRGAAWKFLSSPPVPCSTCSHTNRKNPHCKINTFESEITLRFFEDVCIRKEWIKKRNAWSRRAYTFLVESRRISNENRNLCPDPNPNRSASWVREYCFRRQPVWLIAFPERCIDALVRCGKLFNENPLSLFRTVYYFHGNRYMIFRRRLIRPSVRIFLNTTMNAYWSNSITDTE